MSATETITNSVSHMVSLTNPLLSPEPAMVSRKLKLLSPVVTCGDPAEYEWPLGNSNKQSNTASEIFETIKFVCEEFDELKFALERNVLHIYDPTCYEGMKMLCDKYNKVVKDALHLYKGTSIQNRVGKTQVSTELLHHIIQMCYNHSVGDPQKLNKFYEPFSPEVYGETSFKFVQQMINEFTFDDNDIFIDLGSGVGQVILHMAAMTKCRCIGIEKAELPAQCAEKMQAKFKLWMSWFGKEYSDFELHKGDFFNEEYTSLFPSAKFIFVNNFAFGPEVDHKLKKEFAENLRQGARILSSKAFCPLNFRISYRNQNDIGCMMHVQEILPQDAQSVSWTGKPVSYYLHTIDRTLIEKYYIENPKSNKKSTNGSEKRGRKGSKNKNSDDNSSGTIKGDSSPESKDEIIPTKWTRKSWGNYINNSATPTTVNSSNSTSESSSKHRSRGSSTSSRTGSKTNTNTSPSKNSTNGHESSSMEPSKKKNGRGRPKKIQLTEKITDAAEVKSIVELIDESSNQTLIEQPVSEEEEPEKLEKPKGEIKEEEEEAPVEVAPRRPGRPRKNVTVIKPENSNSNGSTKRAKTVKGPSLDDLKLLHDKTLESIDSFLDPEKPPRGCVDQKLYSRGNSLVPNIELASDQEFNFDDQIPPIFSPEAVDTSAPAVSNPNGVKVYKGVSYDELGLIFREAMIKFMNYTKKQEFRQNLLEKIRFEENRRNEFRFQENELKRLIYEEKYSAFQNIKENLSKMNIESYSDMVSKFNDEVRNNGKFKLEVTEMKKKLLALSKENEALEEQKRIADHHRRIAEEMAAKARAEAERIAAAERKVAEEVAAAAAAAAASAAAASAASTRNAYEVSSMKREEGQSPKPNYKEPKYKKYLRSQESTSSHALALKASNKLNTEFISQISNDSTDTKLHPTRHSNNASEANGESSGGTLTSAPGMNSIIHNDLERVEYLIYKTLTQPDKDGQRSKAGPSPVHGTVTVPEHSGIPHTNGYSETPSTKAAASKTTQKRTRKTRVEMIKTKKDRQVILTSSAGCQTMQLVRTPQQPAISRDASIDMTIDSVINSSIKCEEKPFNVKLKINCKSNTVNILECTDEALLKEQQEAHCEANSKRKFASEESASSKRRGSEKNLKELAKSESGSESKPSIVLKLSSNDGQYYQLRNSTVENNDNYHPVPPKKSSYRIAQSEASIKVQTASLTATAKKSDLSASPPQIPTLKLSTAQYYRSNPLTDESQVHPNNHKESTQSPSLSFPSSRSSSVDSFTAINTAPAKKTRKTRSSSKKATNSSSNSNSVQPTNGYIPAAEGLMYQSQQQQNGAIPPTADNFMTNYQNATNFMNIGESAKNMFTGNSYLGNSLHQPNFDAAHFAAYSNVNNNHNRHFKNAAEPPVHHRKMKDHQGNSKGANGNHFYDGGVNSSQMKPPVNFSYHHQLSSCMMEKGNPTDLLNHHQAALPTQNGFDYSAALNCRYDNATTNYLPNGQLHPPNNMDPLLKRSKNDSQVGNAHANGYYNPNVVFS